MLSFVVAIAENNVIGSEGCLPWHLPADLKKFKDLTLSKSKTIIMGRKTFESLPKILPGRKHIVLTRNTDFNVTSEDVSVLHSMDELKPYIDSEQEYFVIGGAEIFNALFPYAKRIYLTVIHKNFEGDTFFPQFDENQWQIVDKIPGTVDEKNIYPHAYLTLDKK